MGYYTNAVDVRKLYKKIDTSGITDNDIDFYIMTAESEINGIIATKYTIPVSPTPDLLKNLSAELTITKILDRYFTAETHSRNDWRDVRKKEVVDILNKIADGKILMVNSAGTVVTQRDDLTELYSSTEDYTPTFGHGHYADEEIDEDGIDDEEDERDN